MPETLAGRVLAEEHRLLVETLAEIAAGARRPKAREGSAA